MEIREQYTAYSRTSDGSNVLIIEDGLQPNYELWSKLQEFFQNNYWIYQWKCKNRVESLVEGSNAPFCNDFYIGHTNNYEKRKQEHIKSCNNSKTKNHFCKIYQCIRANGGIDNWEMVILEQFCANNRKEAELKEQQYIDKMKPSLNMCRAVGLPKVITGYADFSLKV